MSNSSGGNVILGTLVGAAVGFAAGILLAPAKGAETRENLADKSDDLKDSINKVAGQAMASLNELRETAERSIKSESSRVRSAVKKESDKFEADVQNI